MIAGIQVFFSVVVFHRQDVFLKEELTGIILSPAG